MTLTSKTPGVRVVVHKWHEFPTCGASWQANLCGVKDHPWRFDKFLISKSDWHKVTCKNCLNRRKKINPKDKRPRMAIKAAKAVLKNDTPAARAAMQIKILRYGISLLKVKEKP